MAASSSRFYAADFLIENKLIDWGANEHIVLYSRQTRILRRHHAIMRRYEDRIHPPQPSHN